MFHLVYVDNMPTQLPLESTDLFGDLLFPYVSDILSSDAKKPLESESFSYPIQSVGFLGISYSEN